MQYIPGPDLPTGGTISGLDGIRDAYATGRGSFKTRARVSIEPITPRKMGLIVTELPYLVGPERVIEKIKDGVNAKKIQGISDVNDLTDRKHGLRLVIGIKTGFSPEAVLEQLYRLTPLEESMGINNVALVDGGPRTLGLLDLLHVYIGHRFQVIIRRTRFRLARRKERLHLVEGLLVAILDIDEVIQVIRRSDDSEQARTRLMDIFELSQLQAEYILELRLRRLTRFSRIELETERDALLAEIAYLEELLGSEHLLRQVVSTELDEVSEKFGTPRRTLLTEAKPSLATTGRRGCGRSRPRDPGRAMHGPPLDERAGSCGSTSPTAPPSLRPPRRSKHDAIRSIVSATSRGELGAVTNRGRLLRFSPVDLPVAPANSVQLGAGARDRGLPSARQGRSTFSRSSRWSPTCRSRWAPVTASSSGSPRPDIPRAPSSS